MTDEARPAVERVHPPLWLVRVINPVVRRLVAHGRAPADVVVLHLRGRRTGASYDVPVGTLEVDGRRVVVTNSGWRHNLAAAPGDAATIEVTVRGRRRPVRATLVQDADTVAALYDRLIGERGLRQARRRLGVRVNVDRAPTREELRAMVEASGLSVVELGAPL